MFYKEIISEPSQSLWDNLVELARNHWLNNRSNEMEVEYDHRVRKAYRKIWHVGYRAGVGFYYYMVKVAPSDDTKQAIRDTILMEYRVRFQEDILPGIRSQWDERFNAANFPQRINTFYTRHPWLRFYTEPNQPVPPNALVNLFIHEVIHSWLEYTGITDYGSSVAISWQAFNEDGFCKRLNGFPLSDINQFYFDVPDPHLQLVDFGLNLEQLLPDYRLRRGDIFRLLTTAFELPVMTSSSQNVMCALPVALEELQVQDDLTKSICRHWIINLSTESQPQWILASLRSGIWELYIPPDMEADSNFISEKLPQIQQTLQPVHINGIHHYGSNQFSALNDDSAWQAVLFGRILPYCLLNDAPYPLTQYRHTTPYLILLAFIWENLLPNPARSTLVNEQNAIRTAFQTAKPLSAKLWSEQLLLLPQNRPLQRQAFQELNAAQIFQSIDTQKIQISNQGDPTRFTNLITTFEGFNFLQTVYLAMHQQVSRMEITLNQASLGAMPTIPLDLFEAMACYLTSVRINLHDKVNPCAFPPVIFAVNCAARNRLMLSLDHTPSGRIGCWNKTGELLHQLFKGNSKLLTPEWFQGYLNETTRWRQLDYDPVRLPNPNPPTWQRAQIPLMGLHGLNALFSNLKAIKLEQWEESYRHPPYQLTGFFDLNGDRLNEPEIYINHLSKLLQDFYQYYPRHLKFDSLQIILPETKIKLPLPSLILLINTINQANLANRQETPTLLFYGLNLLSLNQQNEWLDALESLADKAKDPLVVLVHFSEFDALSQEDSTQKELILRYRQLQNKILDNQRHLNQLRLQDNTAIFYQGAAGDLDPLVDIRSRQYLLDQPFNGEDQHYLLTGNTPGIQQELQQNVEARHEIQQQIENKTDYYVEEEIPINAYTKDLQRLITRNNFLQRSPDLWASDASFFYRFTGSEFDGNYLINYIEPEALEEIAKFPQVFQMGLVEKHLPFGFYLAHHPQQPKSYILGFDWKKIKNERIKWDSKSLKQQSAFVLHLDTRMPVVPFAGDERQFQLFSSVPEEQEILWKVLTDKNTPSLADGFTAKLILIQWAKKQLNGWQQHEFLDLFFEELTLEQLQILGQLFHYYDANKSTTGSWHFLHIAFEIYHNLGPSSWRKWHKTMMQVIQNGAEFLDKFPLDALGLSFVTLKNKDPAYNTCFFMIFNKHIEMAGYTRFNRLWYAFQSLIAYIDNHSLKLDPRIVQQLLDKQTHFHAVVWIDRLCQCLHELENELFAHKIQQHVLDNLHKIAWEQNGFYYAVKVNRYPYWSDDLCLQKFEGSSQLNGYLPLDPQSEQGVPQPYLLYFSRFLAVNLRLDFISYQHYAQIILPVLKEIETSPTALRTLLQALTLGYDKVQNLNPSQLQSTLMMLNNPEDLAVLSWINQSYSLEGKLQLENYSLRFMHTPLLSKALKLAGLMQNQDLSVQTKLDLLEGLGNFCAYLCSLNGAAYPSNFDESCVRLLNDEISQAILDPSRQLAMKQTPWLIETKKDWTPFAFSEDESCKKAQLHLLDQLASINYPESIWYPNRGELSEALGQINEAETSNFQRRQIIATWIEKGCLIERQDFNFRPLHSHEHEQLEKKLSSHQLPQHEDENQPLISRIVTFFATRADLVNQEPSLNQLAIQFKRIDNKPHFNDLGMVLGALLTFMAKRPAAKLSLQQLTELLDVLMLPDHGERNHFPCDILEKLLTYCERTLVNKNLNALTAELNSVDKRHIRRLITTPISNQVKAILIQSLGAKAIEVWIDAILNTFLQLKEKKIEEVYQLALAENLVKLLLYPKNKSHKMITRLLRVPNLDGEFAKKWFRCQQEVFRQMQKEIDFQSLYTLLPVQGDSKTMLYQEMIAIRTAHFNLAKILQLKALLDKLHEDDLRELAGYCCKTPTPDVDYLIAHLPVNTVRELIHHFETVHQAKNLRHFSVTEEERLQLFRVLKGIKEKGKGYISEAKKNSLLGFLYFINAYAQEKQLESLDNFSLKTAIYQNASWLGESQDEAKRLAYRIQLLALLREVVLRQTGKWVNHTQMLDLIYAAMHSNESILHQVKTGQGKSIITLMRVAFHALTGKNVDVFTAKESLSSRDHEEFGHVYDAIGIAHAYILPGDPEEKYQVGNAHYGAVNYMTPGSFSLYQSALGWSRKTKRAIDFYQPNRVVFFDEVDHALLDQPTMYNFSDSGKEFGQIYNYDTWVYQATYAYYLKIKTELPHNQLGIPYITRMQHLQGLCEAIQARAEFAPVQSEFVETYLTPVVDEENPHKEQSIALRDKMLKNLLTAAFTADNLRQDVDYCIQPVSVTLPGGIGLSCRMAKVVINNQVQTGSSYSELVQQFLHVLLNYSAVKQHTPPNFFITPDTFIALSQNIRYLTSRYYFQVEGCSGTLGDAEDLRLYQEEYGIEHVVKLPPHEVSQSLYLGTLYCKDETQYLQAIVTCLDDHQHHPTLLVSEHDVAVKALSSKLAVQLPFPLTECLIRDTNDSRFTEKEILPKAGQVGAIVNSSRMARGTDIKPETPLGLVVSRANPDIPRYLKQSGGRQGRNGNPGILIDIYNFSIIEREFSAFAHSVEHQERINQLMIREKNHLAVKLVKHQNLGSSKWEWLQEDEALQEMYLKTRVLQFYKRELKLEREQYIRKKERLVSLCSGSVLKVLLDNVGKDQTRINALRKDWLVCREAIESAWQKRMDGALKEDDSTFQRFLEQTESYWIEFADRYPEYFDEPLGHSRERYHPREGGNDKVCSTNDYTHTIIHYYQNWVNQIGTYVQAHYPHLIKRLFYGDTKKGINALYGFYQTLIISSLTLTEEHELTHETTQLFSQLVDLPIPCTTAIPLEKMDEIIRLLAEERCAEDFAKKLACLPHFFQQPLFNPPIVLSAKNLLNLGDTAILLMRMSCSGYIDETHADYRRFSTLEMIVQVSDTLSTSFWETITPNYFQILNLFFNHSAPITRLLTTRFSSWHWQHLIRDLRHYQFLEAEDVDYLHSLLEYLHNHLNLFLDDYHHALKALITIPLYYAHRRFDMREFPPPNCLKQLSVEDNVRFIQFLAEQYMLTTQQIKKYTDLINNNIQNPFLAQDLIDFVVKTVNNLPPNIPIELINSRVETYVQHLNAHELTNSMDTLRELGLALNQFTQCKAITTPENSLPEAGDNEIFLQRCQALILKYQNEQNLYKPITQFRLISQHDYDHLNADETLFVLERWPLHVKEMLDLVVLAKKILEPEAYLQFTDLCFKHQPPFALSLLQKIIQLLDNHQKRLAVNAKKRAQQQRILMDDCLREPGFEKVGKYLSLVEKYQQTLDTNSCWKLWGKTKLLAKDDIVDYFNLLQKIDKLRKSPLKKEMRKQLLKQQSELPRLELFLETLNKTPKVTPDQVVSIFKLWLAHRIQTHEHLAEVLDAQHTANLLESESLDNHRERQRMDVITFSELFNVRSSRPLLRLHLMHSITHSLITISPELLTKCQEEYKNLLHAMVQLNHDQGIHPREHSLQLKQALQALNKIAIEMSVIADQKGQPHHSAEPADTSHASANDERLIEQLKSLYSGPLKLKSKTRKAQAQRFFTAIRERTMDNHEAAGYYTEMLNIVRTIQEAIITEDDQTKNKNRKGYSRLFNVTQELGLILCNNLFASSMDIRIKINAKAWLNHQRDFIIQQFYERLPSDHPLVEKIREYARNPEQALPGDFVRCQQAFERLTPDKIPIGLRYLLTILQGHFAESTLEEVETLPNREYQCA